MHVVVVVMTRIITVVASVCCRRESQRGRWGSWRPALTCGVPVHGLQLGVWGAVGPLRGVLHGWQRGSPGWLWAFSVHVAPGGDITLG